MDWQIKSFTRRCFLTDRPFQDGDAYVSMLLDCGQKGQLERLDFLADREKEFSPLGKILCRWKKVYQRPSVKENGDEQKKTAEHLFFSLFEDLPSGAELNQNAQEPAAEDQEAKEEEGNTDESGDLPLEEEGREALKQILGLLLERKRVFKTVAYTPDHSHQILEHRQMGEVFLVPAGDLRPETVGKIQKKLEGLVVKPK